MECFNTVYGRYCLRDIREAIKEIHNNSIDMIVTDPPWGVRRSDPFDIPDVFFEVLPELYRVLKPGGVLAIYYAVKNLDVLFREVTRYFKYLQMIVRLNPHGSTRSLIGYSDYTPLVLFYKERKPVIRYRVGDVYIGNEVLLSILRHTDKEIIKQFKSTSLTSIIIQLFTDKKSTVLDPFAGYGSIPFVAELLERRWIAFDIDREKYLIAYQLLINTK